MSATPSSLPHAETSRWREFYELTKPRVVMLIVFTAIVGMFLATPGLPPLGALIFGTLGIALASASAAAINQVLDARVDARMARTQGRPLPQGTVSERTALGFAFLLGGAGMLVLTFGVNVLTAVLTFASLIGYAVIYTAYLKRATPQNIVIGGAAGAAPPVLGWTAVTGDVHAHALILFLIIFVWTPPHFWALAIARKDEYAKVGIPMLPVTHGNPLTRQFILLYTILTFIVTLLPWLTRMSGLPYLFAALVLGGLFLWHAIGVWRAKDPAWPMKTFTFSIHYLMALFAALLIDHYIA